MMIITVGGMSTPDHSLAIPVPTPPATDTEASLMELGARLLTLITPGRWVRCQDIHDALAMAARAIEPSANPIVRADHGLEVLAEYLTERQGARAGDTVVDTLRTWTLTIGRDRAATTLRDVAHHRDRSEGRQPPGSADIVRACSDNPGPPGDRHAVLAIVSRLAAQHGEQWSAEDTARDRADDDHAVAAAKRRIDALNTLRTELVDEIDAWAERSLATNPTAATHTETLGQVIDRITIAWVRSRRLGELAGRDPQRRDEARRALTSLAQLCEAYDDLVRDLRTGRRRLPNWRSLKRYGTRP